MKRIGVLLLFFFSHSHAMRVLAQATCYRDKNNWYIYFSNAVDSYSDTHCEYTLILNAKKKTWHIPSTDCFIASSCLISMIKQVHTQRDNYKPLVTKQPTLQSYISHVLCAVEYRDTVAMQTFLDRVLESNGQEDNLLAQLVAS